jgi:hypothetical protein
LSSCRDSTPLPAARRAKTLPREPKSGAGSRIEQICLLVQTILRGIGRKRAADCTIFQPQPITCAAYHSINTLCSAGLQTGVEDWL